MRQPLSFNARDVANIAGLALVYFAIAALSLATFGTNTPIWFANALAVAWLLRQKDAHLLVGIAAVYMADVIAVHLTGTGPPALLAAADTTEIFLATMVMRRLGGPAAALSSAAGMARFIFVCLAAPIISSGFGSLSLGWTEGAPFLSTMGQWYTASALGLLILCPALLIWFTAELRPRVRQGKAIRIALLAGMLATLAVFVFNASNPAWLFILFPALLLLVWSGGLAGASIGSALLVIVGLGETLPGGGAIAHLVYPTVGIVSQVQALQLYLAALSLSSMPLAVVLTDHRRLAHELGRVAEARREFLAAMSHEIRTPMTGVLGMLDLLETEEPTARQRSYIESIRASGRHLLNIINDILDFSRIETGKIELEHIDFSLPVLLERLRALLDPLAREAGIAYCCVVPEGSPPVVKGDPTRLKRVLLNLAGNAIKFTPNGSVTLTVSYRNPAKDGSYRFRFEVRDTGIGIPPERQAQLFSAFAQADSSTTRRFGGSGLGLAISKRLVDAMGGEMGVESGLGHGSLFWFEIPLTEGDAMRTAAGNAQSHRPITPRRLLLAEDVELNRDLIRTILERDGHEVVVAENGLEAVNLASQSRFDMVLMDIHMPVMDGIEATRLIRQLGTPNSGIPIVALTANVMVAEQQRYLDSGMSGVLMKPIDWDRVRAVIDHFADGQGAEAKSSGEPLQERRGTVFDQEVFQRVSQLLPRAHLQVYVDALAADVSALASSAPSDVDTIEAAAHKIVSEAGMLGLSRLSAHAAAVEHACRSRDGVRQTLDGFREASGDVEAYLRPRLDLAVTQALGGLKARR